MEQMRSASQKSKNSSYWQHCHGKNPVHTKNLLVLNLRKETLSRTITRLTKKGLVERQDGEIVLDRTSPSEAFKRLYYDHRASPIPALLADGKVQLLSRLNRHPKNRLT